MVAWRTFGAHMRGAHLTPLAAAACAGIALWFSIGTLAVGSAATDTRLGFLPPLWLLPLFAIAGVVIASWFRVTTPASLPLFFLLVVILPWIPGPVPSAFLFWTGPVVAGVWIAVAVAAAVTRSVRVGDFARTLTNPWLPAAIAFACYLTAGWWLSAIIPVGDEPHYLIITQSVLHDGDIRVANNYDENQNREYFPFPLRPHFGAPGINGEKYSIHAPGISVAVAPAFALFGYPGVVTFLALVAAIGSAAVWRAAHVLTQSSQAAWFGWAAAALSVPFFFQSFVVYPDGLAATLVMFAALPLVEVRITRGRLLAVGSALGLLPWLHARFAVIAASLGVLLCIRIVQGRDRGTRLAAFLIVPAASAIAWFSFFRIVYGRFDPSAPYAGDTQINALNTLSRVPAMLFDQQFGVLPNAPIYAFCFAGLLLLARARPRLAIELALVAAPYVLLTATFRDWWGGASGPGRYQAAILPLLAVPGAWLWARTQRQSTRAIALALLLLSVLTTGVLVAVDGGRLGYNEYDGYARFADWITPVVDVSLGMPSFVRHSAAPALTRAVIWLAALTGAVFILRLLDRNGAATFALATPSVLALAAMCALTIVWALDETAAPNSERSQANILATYDSTRRPNGITYGPLAIQSAETVLPTIALTTPARRAHRTANETLLLVPDVVPGGVYELRFADGRPGSGTANLLIGRQARPSKQWDLESDFHDGSSSLELPVAVGSLLIADQTRTSGGQLTLHPTKIWQRQSRVTADVARRAERYGSATVFFFDLNGVFHEEPGFWVRGGRETQIAAAPLHKGSSIWLFLRNGAAENIVEVEIDGTNQTLDLNPREERVIPLPISSRPAALVRVRSRMGFRPSETDPGSKDTRVLGVWIEFR